MLTKEYKEGSCLLCGGRRNAVYCRRTGNDCIRKCLQCGLLFVDPQPARERLEEYYRISEPDYIPGYQDQIFKRGQTILSAIHKFKKKGALLDVGCGYGYFMDQAVKNGWKVMGVELSPVAARFAGEHFRLDVFAGSITEAGLKEKYFDMISLQHTLEHIPNPLDFLLTLKGKLKDDGVLAIAVPNARSLMARCAGINWVCLDETTHLFHYTKSTLRLLLEKTGFIPIRIGTFQWDTRALLWSVKVLVTGRKNAVLPPSDLRPGPGGAPEAVTEERTGPCKRIMCQAARPLSWLAGKLGLGAEIIILAEKALRQDG